MFPETDSSWIFGGIAHSLTSIHAPPFPLELVSALRSGPWRFDRDNENNKFSLALSACLSRQLAVPLPLGDCVFSLSWLLPTYFLFAVTYDVLQTLADLAHYMHFYNHDQEPHIYNLTGSLAAANLSTLL